MTDRAFQLLAQGRPYRAGELWNITPYQPHFTRAVSCLVEPQEGDVVLVVEATGEAGAVKTYVLAVLERPGLGDARLSLPDPLAQLTLNAQQVSIAAATSVTVSAPETRVVGKVFTVATERFQAVVDSLTLLGRKFHNHMRDQMHQARRLVHRADSRLSVIEGLDQDKSHTKLSQSTLASQQIETAVIQATQDVRIDAQRVTLG